MKNNSKANKGSDDNYPPGRSNEGGNFKKTNTGSSVSEGSNSDERDPQRTGMGQGSQPASVHLNRGDQPGEQSQGKSPNARAEQDDTGRGDETNSPGYGASNNAAGA
ncbi:MAG TPA: hypothetical protein VEY71_04820 [Chitinophagales bacterium]|nr:hypothetical protein [Chitinophagales bacterium]